MDEFGKYLEEHCNYPHFSVEEIELMQEIFEYQQKKIDAVIKWVEENKKSIPLSEWYGYTTEEYVDADDLLELLK